MTLIEDKGKNNDTSNVRNSNSKSNKKCDKISCSKDNKKSNKRNPLHKKKISKDKRKNHFKNKDIKKSISLKNSEISQPVKAPTKNLITIKINKLPAMN